MRESHSEPEPSPLTRLMRWYKTISTSPLHILNIKQSIRDMRDEVLITNDDGESMKEIASWGGGTVLSKKDQHDIQTGYCTIPHHYLFSNY